MLTAGCSKPAPAKPGFRELVEEFVYSSLAFSPVSATSAGYHVHQQVRLDERIDDYSADGIDLQRRFYAGFGKRLAAIDKASLDPEDQADYDILADQIALNLLEFDEIRNYRHNPTLYVELAGNALFNPLVLEYAPKEERFGHIIRRLEKLPALFDQARKQLVDSPGIWIDVALTENEGNLQLVDKELREAMPEALKAGYDRAAAPALEALQAFQTYLRKDLASRQEADWRLGKERYAKKFRYVLATDRTPEQVLAAAEADVKAVQVKMKEIASALKQPSVQAALAKIASKHSTPEMYKADAQRDLEEARQFVRQKNLLALPPRDNLKVIDTPEFMRGIYAVGGFNPAPALEPQLGAFYWLTPIPPGWPKARVESKLREYNFYKLKLLTIHEAIPGHYVQLEYSNDIQPRTRRVLRSIFGNGPYVEGWAQYATQAMLDEGFLGGSPELRLTFLKEELRVLANAILDIRLHTMGMTDQQALDLMMKETFQEREEAMAKLQRAKLSSCQLPTYLVGWRDWIRVRDHVRANAAGGFSLTSFHEKALREGAVPLPVLARLLTGKPL
jgi:uncharacterized protein (DUF885 family)